MLLALAAAAVHGLAAWGDAGATWTALGVAGLLGLVALAVASRGGRAATRTVEWLTYATWAAVVLHAAGPGSELDGRWGLAVVAGGIGLLAAAAAYRAARPPGARPRGARRAGAAAPRRRRGRPRTRCRRRSGAAPNRTSWPSRL